MARFPDCPAASDIFLAPSSHALQNACRGGVTHAEQPASVGVERQLADAGDQIAVGDELAALALLAETEVFDLHQYRDGEAVIDRGIFDVFWRDAGLLERPRAGPDPGGISEIEILAAARSLHRFA